jgi:tetratricopeptide (TPR) repeat protein
VDAAFHADSQQEHALNPYPGLRAFEAEEDYLFFGREKEIDELLRRLRSTRFLAIVGTSGSGKSSLVRCGLISALYGGYMVNAGSSWRVTKFRPGEDPIGNLAAALSAPDVLGSDDELGGSGKFLLESTLRRGPRGLIDAIRLARLPADENILILVDQFEELFRFRRNRRTQNPQDEASGFVKLLLEAARQEDLPIYIVLTMRSDFIGDCMEFSGLPEAVTAGQYLVPRLSRDELRSAITGPAAVGGGTIAPRLVVRLLNEIGDAHDQLPILQHALMRAWDYWERTRQGDEPIDFLHYESIGTLKSALSLHAEEAYREAGSQLTVERMFKALSDTFTDPRGIRRPASVQDLAAICDVPESEILETVEIFRSPERCFLMPPVSVTLESQSIVDLSHESLMRCWTRLAGWAKEERASAETYVHLSRAAAWFENGKAGLWRDPELELGLQWQRKNRPTAAWAERYDLAFDRAIQFLQKSEAERDRLLAEAERARKRKLREYQWAAAIMGLLLLGAGSLAYLARIENTRAEKNLRLAQTAVDEMLLSAGREQARVEADVPQMEEFRRELLSKATAFYNIFISEKPNSETMLNESAAAHFRLGDIDRLQQDAPGAVGEYKKAISNFEDLVRGNPANDQYRQSLANCFNWLGETLRTTGDVGPDTVHAYQNAIRLQQDLVRSSPENVQYRRELARTRYNRGILGYSLGHMSDSDADFREAVRLLTPLAEKQPVSPAAQELARVFNDLGNLVMHADKLPEARELYQHAIQIDEGLVKSDPSNREYKQELATFNNNLAILLMEQQRFDLADKSNRAALDYMDDLAMPAPSLRLEIASAQNVRCQTMESSGSQAADSECLAAFVLINKLAKVPSLRGRPEIQKLSRDLGYNFVELARVRLDAGSVAEAQSSLDSLSRLLPGIPEPDRGNLTTSSRELEQRIRGRQVQK